MKHLVSLFVLSAALAACGGGGGDACQAPVYGPGDRDPSPGAQPTETAQHNKPPKPAPAPSEPTC
jgi:hypothetical protein